MDEKIIVSFIFPCVYLKERYAYGGFLTGGIIYYGFGIYFNWIVSFILSIFFSVLYHREIRSKKL
ncbi:MAG: hypothetical protein K2N64_02215 [Anaeroplasmataceae bacterium]|nr:hypothetical protein [Anaeroplasmataceae bacterium]